MPRRLFLKICAVFLAVMLLTLTAFAQSGLSEQLESLFEKSKELSEKLSAESILNFVLSGIPSFFGQMSKSLGVSIAILIISMIFTAFKENFGLNENIFEFISVCILILSLASPLYLCFEKVKEHLSMMCAFMISFAPTSALLHSASGNTLTAASYSVSTSASVAFLEFLSISVILPCIKAVCSMAAVGSLVKKTNLSGISKMIKSFCLWASGLSFTLFTGIISLSSLMQSSADTLTMKGLKFGAARFIPIAGGMVSESMKTVIASVSFLKSITGISGIVFIIYTVLPPICAILGAKLFFGILSALAKATNQNFAAIYIDEIYSCINILAALLIGCSLSFIILLSVFIKTTVAL